jgi:hypothetical protein
MWPKPPHAVTDDAKESGSNCGSKVVARDEDGDGSDGGDKWQNNRFIVSNMFYSVAT